MPRKTKRYAKRKPKLYKTVKYRGPLQQSIKTTMKYSDIYDFTSAGTTVIDNVWNLNSLFDPDTTGTGHQPRGFDQLMTLYDHYVVIGVAVDAIITSNTISEGTTCIMSVQDNNVNMTSYLDHMEASTRKVVMLSQRGAGGSTKRMRFNINPNKFLGRSKPLSDPQLKGSATSSPTEAAYLHFGHIAADLATTSVVNMALTLTYTAVLIEPKNVAAS